MTYPERFEDFFGHEEDAIRNAATLLAEAKSAFDSGDISQSEFTELSNDIMEIGEIDGLADSLDRKVQFTQAVSHMKQLISAITLIS